LYFPEKYIIYTTVNRNIIQIVDLGWPAITITSPASLSYAGKGFTITRTCTDNIKVIAIEAREAISSSGELKYSEGEYVFRVTAIDHNRNISVNSVKQITALADFDPPQFENVEINRDAGRAAPLVCLRHR
jgi:hypothetical protein